MDPKNFTFKYKLTSKMFSGKETIADVEAIKSTNAFQSVVSDIDGFIPYSFRTGNASRLKDFVITDDASLLENQNVASTPAQGLVAKNGDYIIYLNPNVVKFDPSNGRILTLAEIIMHELGHATQRGLASSDAYFVNPSDDNYRYKENVAYEYESEFVREKGLTPISNSHSSDSVRQRAAGEKPALFYNAIPECFLSGTLIRMADGTQKPIEQIRPGDMVMAFDPKLGRRRILTPKRVSRTFQNSTRQVIDLRGLKCTPGHVFCTGEQDEVGSSIFKTIATILKEDGTIIDEAGAVKRARTGAPIDSIDDTAIRIVFHERASGIERKVLVRAGIPVILQFHGSVDEKSAYHVRSLAEWLATHGFDVHPDGRVSGRDGALYDAVDWPAGSTPFDTIEVQNWVLQATDGQAYTPPWIAALTEVDDRSGLRVAR